MTAETPREFAVPALIQGRIVWATLPDPQGRNPKDRPLIILSHNADQLGDNDEVKVIGISTHQGEAPWNVQVPLPWSPAGNSVTRLREPCSAVCTWTANIKKGTIRKVSGSVPPATLQTILDTIQKIEAHGD